MYRVSTKSVPRQQSFLIPRPLQRRFFIQFTMMTIIGWIVGGIVSMLIERSIMEILPPAILQQQISYSLGQYLSRVVFAVIFGADQAIVLHQYVSGWWWMLATSLGWLICNGVSAAWINSISSIALSLNQNLLPSQVVILGILSTLAYILSGIWLGLFQWLVLRRYATNAWWWNFLPSISFLSISLLVWLLSLIQEFPEVHSAQILYLSGQGLTALILGIFPALGLCRLKRNLPSQ
jgi:hypothetical protein